MSNLPANSASEIEVKRKQWGNLGELIYKKDFELQAKGQSIIAKIPTDFKDIPAVEERFLEVIAELKTLVEDRMKLTNPVNAKMSELMKAEKDVKEAIDKGKVALLDAKQNAANLAAVATAKTDELKRIRESISNYLAQMDGTFKTLIVDQVAHLFEEGLNAGITESAIGEWLQQKKLLTLSEPDFTVKQRMPKPNLNTVEDVQAIWNELSVNIPDPKTYQHEFYRQLDEKFAYWGISLKNKADAIAMTNENAANAKAEVAAEVSAQGTANKLTALAVPVAEVVESTGRSLKTVYEIDVPDTEQGAVLIMAAYIGNLALCRSGIRITSYRKLTVQQMAAALESAKKKDPNFEPLGINFKSKTKL